MDRHHIPTYLPESLHCTHIKDYCLKESILAMFDDLRLLGSNQYPPLNFIGIYFLDFFRLNAKVCQGLTLRRMAENFHELR